MAARHWAELPDAELARKVGKLPAWARNYIEDLKAEAEAATEQLDEATAAASFDEAIAQTWDAVACKRLGAGDRDGAWRAWRAAKIMRDSVLPAA